MRKMKLRILELVGLMIALLFLSPMYIILINSFKTKKEIFLNTIKLPDTFMFDNYFNAVKQMEFLKVLTNSLTITGLSIAIIVICTSMAAWVLVRTKTKTSSLIFFLFVAAMLIPFQSVMLPLMSLLGNIGLLNSRAGIVIAYLGFGSSLSIFLYHGFIKSIPITLEEAAIIEGCNEWQVFWKVVFPLLKPTTVTVAIHNVIWIWNDYLLPSLMLTTKDLRTVPLATFYFFGQYTKEWHLAMAALTLSIIPVIIFYFFAQKQIIKGVTAGSGK